MKTIKGRILELVSELENSVLPQQLNSIELLSAMALHVQRLEEFANEMGIFEDELNKHHLPLNLA